MVAQGIDVSANPEVERIRRLFGAQRAAFNDNPNPRAPERRDALNRLRKALVAGEDRLVAALDKDFAGRSRAETRTELMAAVQGVRYLRRQVYSLMRPERRHAGMLMATTTCHVEYQPLGVVGVMVPFNYPIALAVGPLASALSAGNRVMVKMSEATPATGEAMKAILGEAFDELEVAVVLGEVDVSRAFAATPFDHLLFTGSTETGRHVMRAAAENLTPVTLELGGKSPTLLSEDVSLAMAAERIAFGKALNAGQSCIAPDYVLCPRDRVDAFVAELTRVVEGMYPGMGDNPDYGSLISDSAMARLRGYIEAAVAQGARVIEINPGGLPMEAGKRRMPFTVLTGVHADMQIMREEIFGPILPIVAYDGLDEAIQWIKDRPRPLALNLFDHSARRRRRVLDATHSGGVCVNDTISHFVAEDLPFGGIGDSGMGRHHGRDGFKTFSHHRAVLKRPRLNLARLLYAPHGGWMQRLLFRLFLR